MHKISPASTRKESASTACSRSPPRGSESVNSRMAASGAVMGELEGRVSTGLTTARFEEKHYEAGGGLSAPDSSASSLGAVGWLDHAEGSSTP